MQARVCAGRALEAGALSPGVASLQPKAGGCACTYAHVCISLGQGGKGRAACALHARMGAGAAAGSCRRAMRLPAAVPSALELLDPRTDTPPTLGSLRDVREQGGRCSAHRGRGGVSALERAGQQGELGRQVLAAAGQHGWWLLL